MTFATGAGMFSGSGTVSTFFERLRAALAPEYELLRQLGSGGMGTVHVMDYLEGDATCWRRSGRRIGKA